MLPIAFIEKSKTRAREFGFFDRKIGYVVVKRMGRDRLAANTLLPNRIDAIFQAVMMQFRERHGPSRSRPFRFE